MRQKRAKAYKRLMQSYCLTFGFRQPYQTLVDAQFCKNIAKSGIDVEKQFETVLQGKCKPMITQCCMQELYDLGRDSQYVVDLAKTFERRKCNHREPIPGDECLTSVIGETNKHRYVLATQSEELRNYIRKNVPAVPIMHDKRSVVVMEPMSETTKGKKNEMEESALKASMPTSVLPLPPTSLVDIIGLPSSSTDEASSKSVTATQPPPPKKRKGPKQPNPLSVKKKKAAPPPPSAAGSKGKSKVNGTNANTGEKRKRPSGGDEERAEGEDDKGSDEPVAVNVIGGGDSELGAGPDGESGRKKKKRRRKRKGSAAGGLGAEEGGDDDEGSDPED
ncbi:Uncharacterized proteins of PilT N-term./Vapc superfamily [Phaffia rhodozyma]|uniref:U three protein 23 n=1 Tax=Phaffia rhodozyma TaxID=264483 RepID=A0A0F7SSY0_PHARH|nr:Uncharacterized proteins of PilT N-term./Vapc superfamily [Phaffia rhodozyma]